MLSNMIYAGSRQLEQPGLVVMDEVHYLADRFRGAVWEEVILQLPAHVALVSLSATASSPDEIVAAGPSSREVPIHRIQRARRGPTPSPVLGRPLDTDRDVRAQSPEDTASWSNTE